jgi:hypothetical protein
MAAFVIMFSAYQGWGQAVPPLLVSLMGVAIVLIGVDAAAACASSRLAILSCCGFHRYWSISAGCRFRAPAAKSRILMLSG